MSIMMAKLYVALKEAGATEAAASLAAEEAASYENRLAGIEARLLLLQWMVGLAIGGILTLIVKAFT